MAKKLQTKVVASYGGHSIKANKSVDLTLKVKYDELEKVVMLLQFLNENIDITIKRQGQKAQQLGTFMLKEVKVDHDGASVVKFNSMIDHVNADDINTMVGEDLMQIKLDADSQYQEDKDEEGEDDE
jgi:hypothetical protein